MIDHSTHSIVHQPDLYPVVTTPRLFETSSITLLALSGVVYRVKNTGPSTEPCGTRYESMTLSDSVFNFYGLVPILQIRKLNLS